MNGAKARTAEEVISGRRRIGRLRKTFHTISLVFGIAYGMYPVYLFIYLNEALHRTKAHNPLDSLLTVLAFTMLFEFIAEPITGHFADRYGRRTAVVIAFLLVSIAFVAYACMSLFNSALLVVLLAITAELIIAVGLAFHSGALEAWFVDSVRGVRGWETAKLENDLGWNIQAFTVGSCVGGVFGLLLSTKDRMAAVGPAVPWVLASALVVLLAFYALFSMSETRRRIAPAASEEGVKPLLTNLVNLWLDRPVRSLIFVMSAAYVSQIAFMYFVPLYIQSLLVMDDSGDLLKYLPVLPVVLFIPRFLGPLALNYVSKQPTENNYTVLL